ncbi:hypothetical protein G7050_08550 [Dysgonomonas sp. HDW5A]|uniref:GIN domain-containing protein n=1 Tax=Dysgonomonas sp. HDW5A TaxID=2714926 RepID=UPI00140ABEE2|nr:DUF2807 domain-containing protein [Dysgonomonas sp. HDW5A]QIK59876.1 hypothetical protein G7050_08550 [Dysgonomonas sp. HDW5A]
MRNIFTLILIILSLIMTQAQSSFRQLSLSGFKVNLTPSETPSIHLDDSVGIERVVEDGILEIRVLDQTGRVPKSEITIYTDQLNYLSLHNCQLEMASPIIADSLTIVTASSFGTLKINSDYLSVNIGAGSNFKIEGETKFYDCAVGAGSTLQSKNLLAEKATVNAMGYSNLSLNAKEIIKSKVENTNVKNYYE